MSRGTVLITGITGQDGSFLSKHLLQKEYKVIGIYRSQKNSIDRFFRLRRLGIFNQIDLKELNLENIEELNLFLKKTNVNCVYHLAAQSSVEKSFYEKQLTKDSNITSTLNLISSLKKQNLNCKFIFPSSASIYEGYSNKTVNEDTIPKPKSEYAISKYFIQNELEKNNLYDNYFIPILFSHESEFRKQGYFSQKVILHLIDFAKNGFKKELRVGNLKMSRDIGYADNYMSLLSLLADDTEINKVIVSTNKLVQLLDFCLSALRILNIDFEIDEQGDQINILHKKSKNILIKSDKSSFRKIDLEGIKGDNSLALKNFNWKPIQELDFIVDKMIKFNFNNF